jgi:hypothetical protein
MGWLKEACAHMDFMDESKMKPKGYWTKARILESATKCRLSTSGIKWSLGGN